MRKKTWQFFVHAGGVAFSPEVGLRAGPLWCLPPLVGYGIRLVCLSNEGKFFLVYGPLFVNIRSLLGSGFF